ncbi:MAG: VOC family protein [Devosia sp.]
MTANLNPYIHFKDNAREAMAFYQTVFGGELVLSTFSEGGMSSGPADASLIMHGQLETPTGFMLMGSDTPAHMEHRPGTNITISLSGDEDAALNGYWSKLSAGANVMQPLEKAPWGDSFGMLTDKFGIGWLVNIAAKK